jgi:N-acetylglucosaminyldiphosphoundecaprenol N-acetyl-beta-D-mannosaminyltransferase
MKEVEKSKFGPVELLDIDSDDLIAMMISTLKMEKTNTAFIALHVSFFNNLSNDMYIKSLQHCLLYADGASVVVAAKLNGFKKIQRSATTDIAPRLLTEITKVVARQLRIGLIGGSNQFIEKVKEYFINEYHVEVVYAINGFPLTWEKFHFDNLSKEVDLLFIGMGVPNESIFLASYTIKLRAKIILTCGGWFGFLIQSERRAPKFLQKSGLEWLWRIGQSPKRLLPRYIKGLFNFCRFILRRK